MGQYHILANLDKKEFVHPHDLACGLKLWEQIANNPGTGAALIVLLACSNGRGGGDFMKNEMVGSWAGDRIAVVGDYAEDSDLAPEHKAGSIYGYCTNARYNGPDTDGWVDITPKVAKVLERELGFRYVGGGWKSVIDSDTIVYWKTDTLDAKEAYGWLLEWEDSLELESAPGISQDYDKIRKLVDYFADNYGSIPGTHERIWQKTKEYVISRTIRDIISDLNEIRSGRLTELTDAHL